MDSGAFVLALIDVRKNPTWALRLIPVPLVRHHHSGRPWQLSFNVRRTVRSRDQIKSILDALRWRIVQVEDDGDWWREEQWKLLSNGESFGRELYVTFVVDPMWEGNRKRGQGVYCVRASRAPLENWNDTASLVAELCMTTRRFDDKLAEFRRDVQAYQRAAV